MMGNIIILVSRYLTSAHNHTKPSLKQARDFLVLEHQWPQFRHFCYFVETSIGTILKTFSLQKIKQPTDFHRIPPLNDRISRIYYTSVVIIWFVLETFCSKAVLFYPLVFLCTILRVSFYSYNNWREVTINLQRANILKDNTVSLAS